MKNVPVFINVRDRVTCLKKLVDWLERAGHENIILLDNASTYEPLLEYLRESPHTVKYLGRNLGKSAIWASGQAPNDWYVYTDPDIIPMPCCPYNLVEHLREILRRHDSPKAGPGLYLKDLPEDFIHRQWEEGPELNGAELEPGVRVSQIDTTFALHRPGTEFTYEGLRTAYPFLARHDSWYRMNTPTDEERYYLTHAMGGHLGSGWKTTVGL